MKARGEPLKVTSAFTFEIDLSDHKMNRTRTIEQTLMLSPVQDLNCYAVLGRAMILNDMHSYM